jgi:hypothetical protein
MLILYNEERLEVADKFNAGHIMPTECCIIATGMRARIPENEEHKCWAPPISSAGKFPGNRRPSRI